MNFIVLETYEVELLCILDDYIYYTQWLIYTYMRSEKKIIKRNI